MEERNKDGKEMKRRLEEGYDEGGYRSGWQVLSNSIGGLVAAVLWNAVFVPWSLQATLLGKWIRVEDILRRGSYADGSWCPVSRIRDENEWSRRLIFMGLG